MTEREKIIELVKKCEGFVYRAGDAVFDSTEDIEAFYHAAQADAFEQAAKLCESEYEVMDGFAPTFDTPFQCATAIRQLGKEKK